MYNNNCTQIVARLQYWTLATTWRTFEQQDWFSGQNNAPTPSVKGVCVSFNCVITLILAP